MSTLSTASFSKRFGDWVGGATRQSTQLSAGKSLVESSCHIHALTCHLKIMKRNGWPADMFSLEKLTNKRVPEKQ